MLIYAKQITNRLQFVLDFVFTHQFGLSYTITTSFTEYANCTEPKLIYASENRDLPCQIWAEELLFEESIYPLKINDVVYQNIPTPFGNDANGLLPFDLFSAIFFMLSRYEEYLPFTANQYGQFKATDSYAFKNNFLQQPVVDIWLQDFKEKLQVLYPAVQFREKKFTPVITYDIDTAYAYKGKSKWLNFAGWFKNALQMQFNKIKERVGVLFHNDPDPYDTYALINQIATQYSYKPILFFLVGERSKYNKNINPESTVFKNLVQRLKMEATIGIHPSYDANENPALFQIEKTKLEKIIEAPIYFSRQHYLRLQFPDTYRHLIANGITDDYTMGYAEMPGFRSSTCTPFYFFDLIKNEVTNLTIHPITFMEGSFAEDMRLTPAKALEIMQALLKEVQIVKGEFVCIWHNHTISNKGVWYGWKNVHDTIIKSAMQHG